MRRAMDAGRSFLRGRVEGGRGRVGRGRARHKRQGDERSGLKRTWLACSGDAPCTIALCCVQAWKAMPDATLEVLRGEGRAAGESKLTYGIGRFASREFCSATIRRRCLAPHCTPIDLQYKDQTMVYWKSMAICEICFGLVEHGCPILVLHSPRSAASIDSDSKVFAMTLQTSALSCS